MLDKLNITKISKNNIEIFKNLAQAYEAEFSKFTKKLPDQLGLFPLDTLPFKPYVGYILFYEVIPVGFCLANIESETKDIAEFYIVPSMRKKNLGYQFAVMIFNLYRGKWQVRQIEGAEHAKHFWRNVIKKYTGNECKESVVTDKDWGIVTKQVFQTDF